MSCRAVYYCCERRPDSVRIHYVNDTERQEEEPLTNVLNARLARRENAFTLTNEIQAEVNLDENYALSLDSVIYGETSGNADAFLLNGANNELA